MTVSIDQQFLTECLNELPPKSRKRVGVEYIMERYRYQQLQYEIEVDRRCLAALKQELFNSPACAIPPKTQANARHSRADRPLQTMSGPESGGNLSPGAPSLSTISRGAQ